MIRVDQMDLTENCEGYDVTQKTTSGRWKRNALTGKLYRETEGIDGAVIRLHVIEVVLDKEQRDYFFDRYIKREALTFTSEICEQKKCFIVEDELRLNKIAGIEAWKGTIAFEEIEKIN
ncbi:MAG TPA: hypothetical protein PLO84_10770 [Thermotogota bacterium]|nr:hypothetical protein [Thermotogota bacterium]